MTNTPSTTPKVGWKPYLKIARFDHWIKQVFIVPGIVFALAAVPGTTLDAAFLLRLIFGGLAVCLIASANYVINEWLDAEFDQFHPVKKNRPAVTVGLKAKYIYLEYALFAVAGLAAAWFASVPVFITSGLLLVMGVVYNVKPLRSKDIPFLDVLSESINNALRLLIGWFIVTSQYFPPSTIVLGYWMGGAFLMAMKRFSEYRMINDPELAGLYRKSFARYSEKSLLISAMFYGMMSLFFCGIFIVKYHIEYLIAIPFICGLFVYYISISYRFDSAAQKPEALFREKKLMLYVLFLIVLLGALTFVEIPFLRVLEDPLLIGTH